ncbi:MAG: hypothetical protein VKP62_08660 [Candidatus Sericytochromatia bacterium]|nr:hypothetical protein [Candidatus Sericytochromatia bacterium]
MTSFKHAAILTAAISLLTGCNAGALTMGYLAQRVLRPLATSGSVAGAIPASVKVGYLAWIEIPNEGAVRGKLDFNLTVPKTVEFDLVDTPRANQFALQISPGNDTAEGTYVVLAWDDQNNNNKFEGDQGEKRAAEVYRIRGQASTSNFWTAEKFLFTDKRLEIQMADHNGGLVFTF